MDIGFQTPWMKERDAWVQSASDADILVVIAEVVQLGELDENGGDATETRETILWLATRGKQGREWGIAAEPARKLSPEGRG